MTLFRGDNGGWLIPIVARMLESVRVLFKFFKANLTPIGILSATGEFLRFLLHGFVHISHKTSCHPCWPGLRPRKATNLATSKVGAPYTAGVD